MNTQNKRIVMAVVFPVIAAVMVVIMPYGNQNKASSTSDPTVTMPPFPTGTVSPGTPDDGFGGKPPPLSTQRTPPAVTITPFGGATPDVNSLFPPTPVPPTPTP